MSSAEDVRSVQALDYRGRWSQLVAWRLFLVGCFTLPWTAVQPAGVSLSDGCFAAAAALLVVSPGRRRPRPSTVLQVAAVATGIATLLASTHAVDSDQSVLVGVRLLWVLTGWQWTTRTLLDRPARVLTAAGGYVAGSTVSAAYAVWQIRAASDLAYGRADGLTLHVNDAGGSLAVALAVCAALIAHRRRTVLAVAAFIAGGVGIILSGSVTGMAAASAGIVVVFLLRGARPLTIAGFAPLGVGIWWMLNNVPGLTAAASPVTRFVDATGGGAGDSTLALRLQTYRVAWEAIRTSPFPGHGLDAASGITVSYFGGVGTSELAAHNLLLLAWFQGGFLLLATEVAVLAGAAWGVRGRTSVTGGAAIRDVAVAGLVAGLTFAMTAPVLFQRYFWFPVLLAFAVGGLLRTRRQADRDGHRPGRARISRAPATVGASSGSNR